MKLILVLSASIMLFTACLEDNNAESPPPKPAPQEKAAEVSEFEGFDLKGEKRSCKAMAQDIMCTMQMTDADFFAQKCKEQGHTAFQCGCHDWLCSENLSEKTEQ